MREYGRIHHTFWSSPTTSTLTDDGKMLALYLMTCSHNTMSGVFRLPDGYLVEDLKWDAERVSKGFAELLQNGFAMRCAQTKWTWIVKHLEWNPPENPNQRKAAAKIAHMIPDACSWKREFLGVCGDALGIESPPHAETVTKPLNNSPVPAPVPVPVLSGEKKKRKPAEVPIPSDFAISERVRSWAAEKGHGDLDRHFEAFVSRAKAKGYTYADWDEAFMGAIRDNWAKVQPKTASAIAGVRWK